MSIVIDFILVVILVIIISICIFGSIIITCFKEDIQDTLSVSSEGSTQSKERRKYYITKMNTYINTYMKFELPELNLKTYIKETKKYRNQFQVLCNLSRFRIERPKKSGNKKVSFQEEIEVEERVF